MATSELEIIIISLLISNSPICCTVFVLLTLYFTQIEQVAFGNVTGKRNFDFATHNLSVMNSDHLMNTQNKICKKIET